MHITFHNSIIHVLDTSIGHPILSSKSLPLEDESEHFITKHIEHLFESNETSQVGLREESIFLKEISAYEAENFYAFSCQVAKRFFEYMLNQGGIKRGDLIVCSFSHEENEFLGIIKLNYQEAFIHQVNQENTCITTRLIKEHHIFSKTKIEEALLIERKKGEVQLLDKSKEHYLAELFEVEDVLSTKEKLMAMEQITSQVIEEHFLNPVEAISILKSTIAEHILEASSVPVEKVIQETFKDHEAVEAICMQRMEQCGIKEENIRLMNPKEVKKYMSHKLKTNIGVEIKLPTQMIHDKEFIEFVRESNGTFSIVIKNISEIVNQ